MVEILGQEQIAQQINIIMQQKLKDNLVQLQNHYLIMVQVLNIITGQHINYLKMHHINTQAVNQLITGMVDTSELLH